MKQKTKYKSVRLNIFVTIFCLSICALSIWLFFRDLQSSSSRSDKEQIATISFKFKIAQRKYDDRVVWERLQQDAPLYNGDTIHTADMAQATIKFNEGANVDISENTMLRILLTEGGQVRLSVSDGQVEVDTTNSANSLSLEMGNGMVVNLETGSKISAKLDEAKTGIGLNMKAGNATVKTTDSSSKEASNLSAGESIKVTESGDIKRAPLTVTSVSENQRVLLFEEDKTSPATTLEWFPLEDNSETVVIETSNTKDFSEIINKYEVAETNKVDIPAKAGAVYWRAYKATDAENQVQGKLLFENVVSVEPTSPEHNSVFSYYKEKPNVTFAWRGNENSAKYKIEIGKEQNLSSPDYSIEVSSQNFSLSELADGKYFWRVIPYYTTNGIGWYGATKTNSFEIKKRDTILPPTLSLPIDERQFTYTENNFDADFAWKAESIDSEYTLQISRDENFAEIILNADTREKKLRRTLSVSDFPDGEYYWKILQRASISETETETLSSPSRKFTVAKFVPEKNRLLYPEDLYSISKDTLRTLDFIWKISAENEKLYADEKAMIQFARSENFSDIAYQSEATGSTLRNISLDDGKYFWRVVKGESTTEPRTLFVMGNIPRPEITYPENGKHYLVRGNENLVVKWNKVSDADYYKLRIENTLTQKLICEYSDIRAASFSVPEIPLDSDEAETRLSVQVQAFANETAISAARKSDITETRISFRKIVPTKLVSPANNERIDGLRAKKDGVTFKWEKADIAMENATLNLWRVGSGGRLSLVESYKNPKESVTVPRLNEGNYRWTVSASTKDGLSLDADAPRNFVIAAVPLLPSPVLTAPEKNQKIDGAYLRKNRAVTFSWKNVRDATDYDFVLYQKLPNGALKKIYSSENQKSTQVKLRDLTILDIGNFQWQVKAKNRARDGFVYQTGRVASQDFSIDFSVPKKVEVVDPGELYGE